METPELYDTAPLLDPAALQEAKVTMRDKFPLMVTYFLEDTNNYIRAIAQGVAERKMEAIVLPAHTAKSASRQIGAARMVAIAKAIEFTAREAEDANAAFSTIERLLPALQVAYLHTQDALQEMG